MSESRVRKATSILSDYIICRKMRQTQERISIMTTAIDMPSHFSSVDLANALRDKGERLSLTTVYSTLTILVDAGILRRITFDSKVPLYECSPRLGGNSRTRRSHHHLVCTSCGKITESREPDISPVEIHKMMGRSGAGFEPKDISLIVYGLCRRCTRRTASPRLSPTTNK